MTREKLDKIAADIVTENDQIKAQDLGVMLLLVSRDKQITLASNMDAETALHALDVIREGLATTVAATKQSFVLQPTNKPHVIN